MRRPSLVVALLWSCSSAALVFAAGCEKKPDASASASASASATSTAATASSTVAKDASAAAAADTTTADAGPKLEMSNCPTAVAGTDVSIKDVEGGVEVSVTGKDDASTSAIRERAKRIAQADLTDAGGGRKHDHSGAGGGRTGRCTIIMRNTKLTTADIPGGSKITVKPVDKTELDWLRRETKDRDREAKSTASAGAGAQRMSHCPSAVPGAKTTVKDTKEGVLVTVTGPADAIADIRTRAKHAAEVAKRGDLKKVEHSGEGTGGGGIGRCPIVVEGDTTVDVKDIEGGVEVDVKAKKDAAALQKESKLRAANFGK